MDKIIDFDKNEDWLTNCTLLLNKVFKASSQRPEFRNQREYWKWYYHNRIKVDGERMGRRAEYCRKWRLKKLMN